MRRVLILVVYVSLFTQVTQRAYGILILNALVMVLHTSCYPFKDFSDNLFETVSLVVLTYAAATKAIYPSGGAGLILDTKVKREVFFFSF